MKSSHCKPLFSSAWRVARGRHLPALALSLMLMMLVGPTLAVGADDEIDISGAIARDVLIEQLESRGLDVPDGSDLTLRDYIYNNAGQARLNASVGVWLDAKGRMVPSPEWQRLHKSYCKGSLGNGGSAREATQLLAFDMNRIREKANGKDRSQYSVFAKLIDWKSHKIQKMHEGDSSVMQADNSKTGVRNNPDAEGLPPAMAAAWNGLGVTVGAPVSPCDEPEKPDAGTGAIQPGDGTWQVKLIDLDTHGCSASIASAVKSAATKQMGENRKESLTFAKPFHPKPLMKHDAKLVWTHTGLNKWGTTLAERGSKSMKITAKLRIEVISPTLIKEVGTTTFRMSGPMAKIMGGSGTCRAVSHYDATLLN